MSSLDQERASVLGQGGKRGTEKLGQLGTCGALAGQLWCSRVSWGGLTSVVLHGGHWLREGRGLVTADGED